MIRKTDLNEFQPPWLLSDQITLAWPGVDGEIRIDRLSAAAREYLAELLSQHSRNLAQLAEWVLAAPGYDNHNWCELGEHAVHGPTWPREFVSNDDTTRLMACETCLAIADKVATVLVIQGPEDWLI